MLDEFGTLANIQRRAAAMGGQARKLPPPDVASEARRLAAENNVLREELEVLRRHVVRLQRENHELMAAGAMLTGKIPTVEILRIVSAVTGTTVGLLKGPNRTEGLANARHLAMYLFEQMRPDLSQPQIGLQFAGRDHTTVYHALRKVKSRLNDEPFKSWLDDWRIRDLLARKPQ